MMMITIHDPIAGLLGPWSAELNAGSILLRVVLALTLSAIFGCERASKRHAAGLRTFMMASLNAAAAMMLDLYLQETFNTRFFLLSAVAVLTISSVSVRAVLVSSRGEVKGLTTTTALLASAFVGLTAGLGCYTMTLVVFLAALCVLSVFPSLERWLKDRSNHFEIHLELTENVYLQNFVTTIRRLGLRIDNIERNPAYAGSGLSVYSIAISISSEELKKYKTHTEIVDALGTLKYVYHIEEMH